MRFLRGMLATPAVYPCLFACVFALLEVARRPVSQHLDAYLTALLLGLALGAAQGFVAGLFSKPNAIVWLVFVVALLPAAKPLSWAVHRGHELNVRSVHAGAWGTSLLLLAVLFVIVERSVRARVGVLRSRVLAGLLSLVLLFPVLFVLQPFGFALAVALTWAAALGLTILLASVERARVWLAPVAATFVTSIGIVLPERYAALHAALAALGVGLAAIFGRAWVARRWPSARPGRGQAWAALGLAGVAVLAADQLTRLRPTALRDAGPSRGLVTGMLHVLRRATDFDADGHGLLLLERDCAPWDPSVNPGAHELSGNDIDENCSRGAASGAACAFLKKAEAKNPLPPPYRGDIVLITVDTLRADDASDPSLPALRALSESGLVFTRAYSASTMTVEALPTLIGGLLPTTLPLTWLAPQAAAPKIPPKGLVVALKELGYATAFVGGGERDVLWLDEGVGLGFDERVIFDQNVEPQPLFAAARAAFERMRSEQPRFLWLHCMWVHKPWDTHDDYRAALRKVDAELGRLRSAIAADAMWIFSSDHGDEFFEHGRRYHGSTLYVESIQVPLIISFPGGPRGQVTSVSPTRSLYPTLLAMVSPAHRAITPGPYLCLGQGGCGDLPVPLALDTPSSHLHGLVLGSRHVIQDIATGRIEAFDMLADPAEQRPLVPPPADLVDRLHGWNEHAFGISDPAVFWPYAAPSCR